jgi:hypothetical protein
MSTPYIPSRDSDFDVWANNFQTVIAASPVTYGLAAGDATAITAAYNGWHTAYLAAVTPATRTSVTVAAKDVQKASALIVFRGYAVIIGSNAGVSAGAKTAAGLTNRATGRTPIPAPGTAPILGFVGATPLVATLKYADTSTPTTKAKPFGAIQIELWLSIGATPPVGGPAGCNFYGLFTKSPFAVNFITANVGMTAYYYGRWTTRRGLVGPWSAVLIHGII